MMDKKRYYHFDGNNVTFSEKIRQDFEVMKTHNIVEGESLNSSTAVLGIWKKRSHRRYQVFGKNVLMRGLYAEQLKNWHEYFPIGEKMIVIEFEKFKRNRKNMYNDLLDFVGAPPHNISKDDMSVDHGPKINDKRTRKVDHWTIDDENRELLRNFYEPYNNDLADLLGEEWRGVWD